MTEQRSPMIGWEARLRIIGASFALGWVVPAAYYNLDWYGGHWGENATAIGFLLAAALCFLGLHWLPGWPLKALAVCLGIGLTFNNSWNAFESMSTVDNRRADGRKQQIRDADRRSSDRREWSEAVEAAKLTVQLRPPGELQLAVDAYVAQNSTAWNSSRQCQGKLTTSADFCAEVNRLKGLVATAKDRDEKIGKIAEVDKLEAGKPTPTHADDMAANFAVLLAPLNVKPTPEVLAGIRSWRILTKTFALEAMAAIMPVIQIALVEVLIAAIKGAMRLAAMTKARMQKPKTARVQEEPRRNPTTQPKTKLTPEFWRFVADEFGVGTAHSIDATPAYELCCDWRKKRNLPKITQRTFGDQMSEAGPTAGWVRDPNGGYPRYLGVGPRVKGANLKVVS
jgi:hypothetical protein